MKVCRCLMTLLLGMTIISSDALAQRRRAAAAAQSGEMLSQSCFACHGSKGASVATPMPTIGGQSEIYLKNNLQAYKDATRPATIMTRLMKGYSDEEIVAIAKYLAAQPYVRAEQTVDTAKVEAGQKAYQRVCKDCHLRGGREPSEPEYPIVAGQWLSYLQRSLAEITSGKRIVDEKFIASLEKLSKDELDAVLHYFAAQR